MANLDKKFSTEEVEIMLQGFMSKAPETEEFGAYESFLKELQGMEFKFDEMLAGGFDYVGCNPKMTYDELVKIAVDSGTTKLAFCLEMSICILLTLMRGTKVSSMLKRMSRLGKDLFVPIQEKYKIRDNAKATNGAPQVITLSRICNVFPNLVFQIAHKYSSKIKSLIPGVDFTKVVHYWALPGASQMVPNNTGLTTPILNTILAYQRQLRQVLEDYGVEVSNLHPEFFIDLGFKGSAIGQSLKFEVLKEIGAIRQSLQDPTQFHFSTAMINDIKEVIDEDEIIFEPGTWKRIVYDNFLSMFTGEFTPSIGKQSGTPKKQATPKSPQSPKGQARAPIDFN